MRAKGGGLGRASAAALVLALAAAACAGRGIVPRQYVLAAPPRSAEAGVASGPGVSVGPVELPDYLRRPQIVRRSSTYELDASDAEVWGEDLTPAVARVLAEDLAAAIPTNRVVGFPAHEAIDPDYRVIVVVERFEPDAQGSVRLDARWRLARADLRQALAVRRSTITEPAARPDTLAAVEAMSRALDALAREIAAEIRADAAGR